MPKCMGTNLFRYTGLDGVVLDDAFDGTGVSPGFLVTLRSSPAIAAKRESSMSGRLSR